MESIGEKLRITRESKGYSVEQVARDTHIAKRYIEALEEEDFASFPGEPYLLGFLRNYAEFLGLDAQELISLYKNFKIQEQPLPMNELLEKKSKKPILITLVVILAIIGIGIGVYFLVTSNTLGKLAQAGKQEQQKEKSEGREIEFKDEILERRFYQNDIIMVNLKGQKYRVQLAEISDVLTLDIPKGKEEFRLGEEKVLDLDGDNKPEITISLRDIDKRDPSKGVILRFDKVTQSPGLAQQTRKVESDTNVESPTVSSIGATTEPMRVRKTVALLESQAAEPFSLTINFRGYCLFRYISDKQTREERYFHKGETFRIDVSKEIRVWVSNAGALQATVKGVNVEFGKPGQVISGLLKWVKDDVAGLFKLVLVPAY